MLGAFPAGLVAFRPADGGSVLLVWVGFFAVVALLLALDLGVFNRNPHAVSVKEALGWSALWVTIGTSFSGVVYVVYENHVGGAAMPLRPGMVVGDGAQAAVQYLTAYVLEKSLSVDNLFVIALIFSGLGIPQKLQHRVLFYGVVGAVGMRAVMIVGGVWLVSRFDWILYVLGAYLVVSGIRMLSVSEHHGPAESRLMSFLRARLPIAQEEHEGRFFGREADRRVVTTLGLALIAVELTDVVFAVDSIPAVLAVSTDPFIVLTSNVFAILGLRSLYFVLADMMERFRYLKISLAVVLVFVGAKMVLHGAVHIANVVSLGVVLGLVLLGIVASLATNRADADMG